MILGRRRARKATGHSELAAGAGLTGRSELQGSLGARLGAEESGDQRDAEREGGSRRLLGRGARQKSWGTLGAFQPVSYVAYFEQKCPV